MIAPLVVVIGGPNGAGKSSCARRLLPVEVEYVNADEIAREIAGYPSSEVDRRAGRSALGRMDELESRRADFAIETTLAGRSLAARIARMRCGGYRFRLVYLWSISGELSIQRVAARVRLGGHDIPEATIRRRYAAGLRNLFELYLPLADEWDIHENGRDGPRFVAEGSPDSPPVIHDPATWRSLQEALNHVDR